MNSSSSEMLRVSALEMTSTYRRILLKYGFSAEQAGVTAQLFTDNAVDGIYTHSVNRFPKFIQYVKEGHVKPGVDAVLKSSSGCVEQWDGQSGVGVLNALQCTDRAMAIAKQHGMGCVALGQTNHWMRGGAYGWRAAKAGFAFIGWTNTIANTPAWGAIDNKLGNNPLVMAVPHEGEAIVLDMAMSQYSYGSMELYKLKGKRLPVAGGYDSGGKLSDDPEAIMKSRRTLPVGYWKGSGLSLLLDIFVTILSGGLSVSEITRLPAECNLSQVFIAINLSALSHHQAIPALIHQIIDDYHQSIPEPPLRKVRFPGEKILQTRAENIAQGVPVLRQVWEETLGL